MSSQRRTIMGNCDYTISTLQLLKKDLSDIDSKHAEINWAIGGIVIALSSQLLKICDKVFSDAAQYGEPNAVQDITEIQRQFNEFITQMVNHD